MDKNISLKEKTITGVKISAVITTYRGVIDFVLNLILVRLLVPEVFGSMAFAFIIVNLAGMLSTISSSSAIVQRKEEKIEEYLDVAFTIEIFLSVIAALILFAAAPYLLTHLGKPELSFFSQMMALTLPLNKLAFPVIVFVRRLDFKKANIAVAISVPLSAVTTIVTALLGYGIWCFFWGALVSGLTSAIVIWKIIPYRPKLDFDQHIFKKLVRFGMPLTGSAVLAYYYWNVDDFMVGTMLGAEQLGFYWLAFKIPHYILNAQNSITSVVFPAFARAESD
ncbi:MAG: oligosaccharide flippase family protein, partial [Nitrospirota bacterium]